MKPRAARNRGGHRSARGSFLKRGSTGHIDFVSPFPCPFNYGSVPNYLGLEGDLLDALVLGPRLPLGARIRVRAWARDADRPRHGRRQAGVQRPPADPAEKAFVLRFFRFYARCKGVLNIVRGHPGRNACEGWRTAAQAISRAQPRPGSWQGPPVDY